MPKPKPTLKWGSTWRKRGGLQTIWRADCGPMVLYVHDDHQHRKHMQGLLHNNPGSGWYWWMALAGGDAKGFSGPTFPHRDDAMVDAERVAQVLRRTLERKDKARRVAPVVDMRGRRRINLGGT